MKKEIQYPTEEWLENWVDKWIDKHPDTRINDFEELYDEAKDAWWDMQVDKGNPTPFDLTKEQEKASKEARITTSEKKKPANYSLEGKKPRERKPNNVKREIIILLQNALESAHRLDEESIVSHIEQISVTNSEKTIDFELDGKKFSINLVEHRKPKLKE